MEITLRCFIHIPRGKKLQSEKQLNRILSVMHLSIIQTDQLHQKML